MTYWEQFVLDVFEPKFRGYQEFLAHEPFPPGYGIAYKCYDRHGWVLYPIPIHIFIRAFRWMWTDE